VLGHPENRANRQQWRAADRVHLGDRPSGRQGRLRLLGAFRRAEVKIGDKETRKLGYSLCQPDHCEAILPLEDPMVKSLSAAPTVEITIYAVNGTEAQFTVNMKGFTQALADLGK
jgi:hypothetical protein